MLRHALLAIHLLGNCSTGNAQDRADVFGLGKVHELHLELAPREWERLQKVSGGMSLFPPKKPLAPAGEEPYEWHKSPGFGLEFPWAHADLTISGKTIKNVGVRYKGNGSYVSAGDGLKRNFKIDMDHYVDNQRALGLRTITLNAGGMDPSRLREALAYAVYRAAGVPAPRTAFAQVTLTVPGKYDRECVGVYTLVEHVGKEFLRNQFGDGSGLLMKPEGVRGIDYLGADWKWYQARYYPKREATPQEKERLIAFARLISRGDDEAFQKEIGAYLDIDNFLRFIAVTAMLPNTDNFMTTGHNYFLHLHPKSHRFAFMPWDLDISFAGFPLMGSVTQQVNLDLMKPAQGKLKLIDRLLAIPEVDARYRQILRDIAAQAFTKGKLLADIDVMEKALKEPLAREARAKQARKEKGDVLGALVVGLFDPQPPVRSFVERRAAAVAKQVAGLQPEGK
jgi:spore coat protein CotH